MKTHLEIRKIYKKYWENLNHKEIPSISLVPENDPTTLFTTAGMQPLIPYLLGDSHSLGKRLFNIQKCFRSQDIEEVGDNRHDTFFEMIGNWSLGDYFKEEQLEWAFNFFTKELGLDKNKLYVTVFEGTQEVPKDIESYEIWKKLGIAEDHIFFYGSSKNWWSRSGIPENMPDGEIGGPDSEIFYDFGVEHNKKFGEKCHPNCDCGRFLEIGNSVFIQYIKNNGKLVELKNKNVDFGGGLERILAALKNNPDIFLTDLFMPIISEIENEMNIKYSDDLVKNKIRIIADHLKSATMLLSDGVYPSNKLQGYVLRRLIRRSAVKFYQLTNKTPDLSKFIKIVNSILDLYNGIYFEKEKIQENILNLLGDEINRFNKTLEKGIKEIQKLETIDGKKAFDLYQSVGFPFEITEELFLEKGIKINRGEFKKEFEKHKEISRTASSGMFKGGLADNNEKTVKFHTCAHILLQVLKEKYGEEVRQEGANITGERLRFDFRLLHKPDDVEKQDIENKINEIIKKEIPVFFEDLSKEEALKIGANAFFKEKYPDKVKVYFIGNNKEDLSKNWSKEFCGGPHVKNTSEIERITVKKIEKIGANIMRVYII